MPLKKPIIGPLTKNEHIRWIACLADMQKTRYFARFDNFGAAGRR